MSIADAAVFVAQAWPVFPTAGKVPLVKWRERATRDPAAVRAMFTPDATGIGVPMGEEAGVFLVDLDGADGLEWIAANRARLPATRLHRTPSGGLHLLFRYPTGRTIKNSVRKIAPGVDIRGAGGFAVFPPTRGYTIDDDAMPADAPRWLLDLIDPPAAPPAPREPYTRERIPERYIEAALDRECQAVASAPEGTRNDTLNRAAFSLGTLVAAGALPESVARAELRAAALHAGLDPRETDLTIASGLAGGMQHPRQIPERERPARAEQRATPAPAYDPETGEIIDNPTNLKDTGKPKILPLILWRDVTAATEGADFVQGLLVEGAMSVTYGPSNCGKTFFMTDLALHVALGRDWKGRKIDPGAVIYCALEGAHGIQNRVAAFRLKHGLAGRDVPFAIVPVSLDLLDPEADTGPLIDTIQHVARTFNVPVRLTVLDTLSRAMAGGNENSPEDMGALVKSGDRVRQITKSHVAWIHHSGKDQAQGARGHSLLRAATDTEIEISRPDKNSPSVARVTKQREMPIEGEWTFTLEGVQLGTDRWGAPVTSCIVVDAEAEAAAVRRLPQSARDALSALHEALIKAGQRNRHPDVPAGARVVRLEAWRLEFYTRSHLDNQEARKKAFQRGVKDLRDLGVVGVMHDLAWLTEGLQHD